MKTVTKTLRRELRKMASFEKINIAITNENIPLKEKGKWHLEESTRQHPELYHELWIKGS